MPTASLPCAAVPIAVRPSTPWLALRGGRRPQSAGQGASARPQCKPTTSRTAALPLALSIHRGADDGICKKTGRMIGILLFVQGAGGALVNFGLLRPVVSVPPGFLVNAAAHPLEVGSAALVGLFLGARSVGIAIVAWPVFRRHSQALALWFGALAVVSFAVLAVENIAVLSMLSLSQAYVKAGAADASQLEAIGAVVRSARYWAHYTNLLVASGMLLVFYRVLYRFALIPRALAAVALAAVAMPFFGLRFAFSAFASCS